MREHLAACAECREVFEIKKRLVTGPVEVPDDVERALVESALSGAAAARETGRPGRSRTQRYLVPAMAAAMIIFVFFTGFLLGELRNLDREAGRLRGEIKAMETVLSIRGREADGPAGAGSLFGLLSGGRTSRGAMTIGEAARFLRAIPEDTPLLSESDAERMIAETPGLRRLTGRMEERPWEGGLTSGELLMLIMSLDIDPKTRIPAKWDIEREVI
ncbi:MAG TPA: hypothetical protein ENO08_03745 [Candidatus Eisenbacteria bacterium]|uniref:Zf-HC2 domain-containing protein n=1 Tax=Eiseniibacteriota bacterium TaxID=2212470 RepID=A0A7V2AUR1_UNCEI|nr:hypothetical protein [Candidatus Eisenbacteria bacterium]